MGTQFCNEIIGFLQGELPPRMKQILWAGLEQVVQTTTPSDCERKYNCIPPIHKVDRHIDISGELFRRETLMGDWTKRYIYVEKDIFYCDRGVLDYLHTPLWNLELSNNFKKLYQAMTSSSKTYHTAATKTEHESPPDLVSSIAKKSA